MGTGGILAIVGEERKWMQMAVFQREQSQSSPCHSQAGKQAWKGVLAGGREAAPPYSLTLDRRLDACDGCRQLGESGEQSLSSFSLLPP